MKAIWNKSGIPNSGIKKQYWNLKDEEVERIRRLEVEKR
jgi:hypothetical protein